MRKRKPHLLVVPAIVLLVQAIVFHGTATALGSSSLHDLPWNSDHIDRLPPDVRAAVLRRCSGAMHAGHYFATYLDHGRIVRLHFENLRCEGAQSFRRGNSCLHEEFAAVGAHHRLVKRYYAPCND